MSRWTILYDQAAKEFAEACRQKSRANKRGWKRRLSWLDGELAKEGEK